MIQTTEENWFYLKKKNRKYTLGEKKIIWILKKAEYVLKVEKDTLERFRDGLNKFSKQQKLNPPTLPLGSQSATFAKSFLAEHANCHRNSCNQSSPKKAVEMGQQLTEVKRYRILSITRFWIGIRLSMLWLWLVDIY